MIGNGDFGSPLTGGEETRLGDTLGAPVWEGTGELAQELNCDVTTTLPMGDVVAGLEPGLYALTARVADAPSRRGLGGLGDAVETPDFLELSLDREGYAPGDTARARIVVPNAGQLLVAAMGDRLIESRTLAVEAGDTVIDLAVTDRLGARAPT